MTHRFYGDLAVWWPLISPPEEYAEEAAFAAQVLGTASIPVREVLELGSGGGHNALHLEAGFAMTLVDLSGDMLAVSRRLNPECDHHRGDMRTLRLGRSFDAVFVHDAIGYMTTEADLLRSEGGHRGDLRGSDAPRAVRRAPAVRRAVARILGQGKTG